MNIDEAIITKCGGSPTSPCRIWLARSLGESISNLAKPVGMGLAPSADQLANAANRIINDFIEHGWIPPHQADAMLAERAVQP
jgi:hypothetical protein